MKLGSILKAGIGSNPAGKNGEDRPVSSPRVFVCAGELSGDGMLGQLLERLGREFPGLETMGFGGPETVRQGLKPLFPLSKMALNGIWDVLRHFLFCIRLYFKALQSVRRFRPHLLILVDYPGLNLRLLKRARKSGIRVFYLSPPQSWAYKKPALDLFAGVPVQVLYPFEAAPYRKAGALVSAGHFLRISTPDRTPSKSCLCLCPGSRLEVLRRNLPFWMAWLWKSGWLSYKGDVLVSPKREGTRFKLEDLMVLVPEYLAEEARFVLKRHGQGVRVETDKEKAFGEAAWALAFPGTITLELALHRIPTAAFALVDPLTYLVAKRKLATPWLSMPNVLLGSEVLPEWSGCPGPAANRALERLMESLISVKRERESEGGNLISRLEAAIGTGNGSDRAFEVCRDLLKA